MAKLVSAQKAYTVELDQDEAELILMLTGSLGNGANALDQAANCIWEAIGEAVRGDRLSYVIGDIEYTAEVSIKEVK